MQNFFQNNDSKTALEAQYAAQKIAFAPIVFQVARSMRDLGILETLYQHDKVGLSMHAIAKNTNLSPYGVQTLLETSLSADIVKCNEDKYQLTKTGYFLLKDTMTRINMDYNHDVNYQGLFYLDEAIQKEKASGLKVFGDWNTIYPALSSLPTKAQKSWFSFDHYYSDTAFEPAIEILLKNKPKKILDIGGNTGKFSIKLAKSNGAISVSILDLPEQIKLAKKNIHTAQLNQQINFIPLNILDHNEAIPTGYDIIWMSQFLDCFKEADIIKILKRVKASMSTNSHLYIMEPLWDKQRFETSAYCIINTSPYFTAMANGYSKMFNAQDMQRYIEASGLKIIKEEHNIGICQSILICQ
ncbi:MAG: Biotin synthesis protein BioC [uncultured Sulfurovum sp.]|uniref:Biotin synthesis protein BioC n=1 Tax=uncultured Sulfurovum sp. TaxID=269237 RepID=A0A6S6TCC9_9BACT|nr:MAG: Biotin synthesis protein BioC [uncultured Sulfurovum sp.]